MKKSLKLFIIGLFLFFSTLFCSFSVEAANTAKMSDGNIIFETVDTKATSNIRWLTAGFTIRKDRSNGNPLKDNDYAMVSLLPDFQEVEDSGDGIYHITYTIPREKVDRALIRAGLEEIKDGDTIYFNTVFKIKVNNVIQGKRYYSLSDIKHAAGWRNPNDFNEHFDIGITFHSAKYPVTIEYRTISNELIKEEKIGKWKAGKEISVSLDGEKSRGGKEYILYKSYYVNLSKPAKKKNMQIVPEENYGSNQIQSGKLRIGGMKIMACMKIKPEPLDEPETPPEDSSPIPTGSPPIPVETIEKKIALDKVQSKALLEAEQRGNEKYDAKLSIPSGEKLYALGFADEALLEYKFTRYEGSIVYCVGITAEYHLRWKEKQEDEWVWHNRTVNGDKTVYIIRKYSYWTVDYFNYYTADKIKIENKVLPSEKVLMEQLEETPEYDYKKTEHNYPLSENITVNMGSYSQTVSSVSSSPNYLNYETIARTYAEPVRVSNDYLEFRGDTIFDDGECMESTDAPNLPTDPNGTKEFYQDGLVIPINKENKEYLSEAYVYYKRKISAVENVSSEEAENAADQLICVIEDINPVTVHTPIACQGKVTDQSYLCQSVMPNHARCQLVLDTEFSVSASCYGTHLSYKGYGTRDYADFCKGLEVCFPFDVYLGNTFQKAGTWNVISETNTYYLPIWVKEGEYTILFRATAKNGSIGSTGIENANLDPDYYAATAEVPVEVSGRIYGLKLYDITDYPLWKEVFRTENGEKLSGMAYYIGTKNQNGADMGLKSIYTLPVLAGSHPYYKNTGYLKTGYILRCSLKTIGSFYHKEDSIEIMPEFYFLDKNGENRERVDIYYDESVFGRYQKLIKIGSERDRTNIRSLCLGEEGLSVDKKEIEDTAFGKELDKEVLKSEKAVWYGYKDLVLSSMLQTFSGIFHIKGQNKTAPLEMDKKNILKSKQNWYFEYYLPSSIHIAPYEYDVDGYALHYPIDFRENFWRKEGFLVVQFHIYANRDHKRTLSYINEINAAEGYCNMWKQEGFFYEKTDENGIKFHLQDGDFMVFYCGSQYAVSVGEDYMEGGTH